MRCVVQRVSRASVTVAGERVSEIGRGFMVLVGALEGDGEEDARYCADKIAGLRVFEDDAEKMNLSVAAGKSCWSASLRCWGTHGTAGGRAFRTRRDRRSRSRCATGCAIC